MTEKYKPKSKIAHVSSEIGTLRLEANDAGLQRIDFIDNTITDETEEINSILISAIQQLQEYFKGERTYFSVPLMPEGTHFQQNVWEELQQIPFAKTISYETLARNLGDIKVIRAAASANGRNPLPIIIPCHRVIGKDGSLAGYSGGLWRKQWLLRFEMREIQAELFLQTK